MQWAAVSVASNLTQWKSSTPLSTQTKKKLPSCENTEVKLNYRVSIAPHLVERLMHGGGENLRRSDQFKGQNEDQKLRPITTL